MYLHRNGFEYTEEEVMDLFDDMLNELYNGVSIVRIEFLPSKILKECDPVAYRTEFSNFTYFEGFEEI